MDWVRKNKYPTSSMCRFILPILPLAMMFAGYAIAVLEQKWAWEGDSAADAYG
jgi:hypothetical protein